MTYQFHICEGLSDKAVRRLMKATEPTLKGYALGLLVYDVVGGKIEGFARQYISRVKYLTDI